MFNMKRFLSVLLILSIVLSLTACSSEKPRKVGKYTSKIVVNSVESSIVAENDNYAMHWDSDKACVLIEDKNTGYIWSTIPNDFYNGAEAGPRAEVLLNSPIIVTYATSPNNTLKTINGSNVFDDGMITVKKVKNGLQVGYFFNNVEISIPVIYKLYDDHFTVTVDPAGILENEHKVYQVEIAPFLTAIPSSAEKDSFLFVPSGSGALMYTDERDGKERLYEEAVYGKDLAVFDDHITENAYNVSLPVYGVSRGENSLFAIIEEGASSCEIIASAGDSTVGYSNVCAAFCVRGHNTEVVKMAGSGAGSSRVNTYSDGLINGKCTVAFYPLAKENSGYSGMAECYRNYLTKNFNIKKTVDDTALYLQILGGAMVDESFVGLPYQKLEAATTVDAANKIVSELEESLGVKPVLQLKGFGQTGVDISKVGGAFKLNSKLGSWKDIEALNSLCDVYFDFDIVRFDTSGKGFKTYSNSAKAENEGTAYQYYYDVASGSRVEEKGRYRLLARNELSNALTKALKATDKKELTGISLSTLGELSYSDYRSPKYYSKGNMDSDVSDMLASAREKVSVMTSNSNAYAAGHSDHIISTPSFTSGYNSIDVEIPFYRMVFKGIVSMSSESINLSANPRREVLKAAETGCGLLYTLTDEYNSKFRLSDSSFAKSVYADNKEIIISDYNEFGKYFAKVSNTSVKQHTVLQNGVNQTVFENGITVIVNYTDDAVETPLGVVQANSFVYQ